MARTEDGDSIESGLSFSGALKRHLRMVCPLLDVPPFYPPWKYATSIAARTALTSQEKKTRLDGGVRAAPSLRSANKSYSLLRFTTPAGFVHAD
jgi:hypothetical protein